MPNVHAEMREISRAIHRRAWSEARGLLLDAGVSQPAVAAFLAFEIESSADLPYPAARRRQA